MSNRQIGTLIEFFDSSVENNIIPALVLNPERVVYLGNSIDPDRKRAVELFFKTRGKTVPIFADVPKLGVEATAAALEELVRNHGDCVLGADITGGSEELLVALGMIVERCKIPLYRIMNDQSLRCIFGEAPRNVHTPYLSCDELVRLHGGKIISSGYEKKDADNGLFAAVDRLWPALQEDCIAWNIGGSILAPLAQNRSDLYASIAKPRNQNRSFDTALTLLRRLKKIGAVLDLSTEGKEVSFRFAGEHERNILSKSGKLLELRVIQAALNSPEFNDARQSVSVDWDGVTKGGRGSERDTTNEIDVFLMRGCRPVFISCKNGELHKEAIYELDAVANRFGGARARKVIACSYLSTSGSSREYIRQRAADMNVILIERVDEMTTAELTAALHQASEQ